MFAEREEARRAAGTCERTTPAIDIDELYRVFCVSLPESLRVVAEALPSRLGLTTAKGVPWSGVFAHAGTLQAPALLFAGAPGLSPEQIERAVLAHLLGVIGAFAQDRMSDGQVSPDPELVGLLFALREARNAALGAAGMQAYVVADELQRVSTDRERQILSQQRPVSWRQYRELSVAKQRVGIVASVVLGQLSGLDVRRLRVLERTVLSATLALQFHDDVVDWEDDWARGGAWAVSLARHVLGEQGDLRGGLGRVREGILRSQVLVHMLECSQRELRATARRARLLPAAKVEAWATNEARRVQELGRLESAHPGYAVRARRLGPWASEVLA